MKKQLPEKFRIVAGKYATKKEDGPNGAFIIPAPVPKVKGHCILIMSNSMLGWEHIALRHYNTSGMTAMKTKPSMADIDLIRHTFWNDDETVIQIYPSKDLYTQDSDEIVHLWRFAPPNTSDTMPLPPANVAELFGYTLGPRGKKQKQRVEELMKTLSVNEKPSE